MWSSKRQPIWESTLYNLNTAVGTDSPIQYNNTDYYPSVNRTTMNEELVGNNFKENCGQILSQFENESFKFVVERNHTNVAPDSDLIIKPYMFLNMGLDEFNCKPIDLNEVSEYLEDNEWVALGFFINGDEELVYEERAITLSKATWYTRKENYQIFDLVQKTYLPNNFNLNCVTYVVFRKLTDSNIIIGYVNHHLVALPTFDTGESSDKKHLWTGTNIMDSGIFESLIEPRIIGARVYNSTIIADDDFSISISENSEINCILNYLPMFPTKIKTNLKYKIENNKYLIEKGTGYIVFEINTGDFASKYSEFSKSGIYTLIYNVYGD